MEILFSSKCLSKVAEITHGEMLKKINRIKKAIPEFKDDVRESQEPNRMNAYYRVCYLTEAGARLVRESFRDLAQRKRLDEYIGSVLESGKQGNMDGKNGNNGNNGKNGEAY